MTGNDATFKTDTGEDPDKYLLRVKRGMYATTADAITVAHALRARILKRTAEGVDVRGNRFAEYSTKGPYYVKGAKFASYGDWKRSGLGRKNVDLSGRRQQMLQSMNIRVNGVELTPKQAPTGGDDRRATEFTIGFWDQTAATIAAAHNSGAKTGRGHKVTLPQREFFSLSDADLKWGDDLLGTLIADRMENL